MPTRATGRYRHAMGERRSLLRRVRELPPPVADGLLAALIAVVGLTQLLFESPLVARLGWDFRDPDALAVLVTLAQAAPLVWRRRAPRLVLAATFAAAMLTLLLGYQPTWAQAAMLVALYTVAAHRRDGSRWRPPCCWPMAWSCTG
jgi:hypothetical protein